jgi:hypothetical protein
MERLMIPWLQKMTRARQAITDSSIRAKAREIANTLEIGHAQFKASSGWVDNFKRRHNIRKGVYHGAQSAEDNETNQQGGGQIRLDRFENHPAPDGHPQNNSIGRESHGNLEVPILPAPIRGSAEIESTMLENETSSCEPELQEAFARIFAWVDGGGPGQIAPEDREVLRRLKRRANCQIQISSYER